VSFIFPHYLSKLCWVFKKLTLKFKKIKEEEINIQTQNSMLRMYKPVID